MQKTIVTHDGKFHADEVFAVSALKLLEPDALLVRTRNLERIAKGDYVVDVGGVYEPAINRFDHHQQAGAGVRGNGIPYAAFGLVWKKFGEQICGSADIALRVEIVLVAPIDANDNGVDLSTPKYEGVSPYAIPDAVRSFIPTFEEKEVSLDTRFTEVSRFAKQILEREIERARALVNGIGQVRLAYETAMDKRLIVMDGDYSWKDTLAGLPEPIYVVHPQDDTWRLYCVRTDPHLFVNRKDLPESWAGLRDEALAKVTGVPGAVFVHRNRFMAVVKSKEGALALAQKALFN